MAETQGSKTSSKIMHGNASPFKKYCNLVHGDISFFKILRNEFLMFFFGDLPGPLGLVFRKKLFPCMFKKCGKGVVFGRGMSVRHAYKIIIGDGCIFDDGVTIDAKGDGNDGIIFGEQVFIGKRSIVYCKGGNITLHDKVNISSNCTVFSSNSLEIGAGCMIGAYSYMLSGGEYDYTDPTPFAEQCGMNTKGPLKIGADCWLGCKVTVLDSAQNIGDRCVIAAGAMVISEIPARSLVVGVPGKVIRKV